MGSPYRPYTSWRERCHLVVPSDIVPFVFDQAFDLRSTVDALKELQRSSLAPVDGRGDAGRIICRGSPEQEDAIGSQHGETVADCAPQLPFTKVERGYDVHRPDDVGLMPERLQDVQRLEAEI